MAGAPTFHVLIATIGRPSLARMLDSLLPQLRPCDALTIVFDGFVEPPTDIHRSVERAACAVLLKAEPARLGGHGHGIRTKWPMWRRRGTTLWRTPTMTTCTCQGRLTFCAHSAPPIATACTSRGSCTLKVGRFSRGTVSTSSRWATLERRVGLFPVPSRRAAHCRGRYSVEATASTLRPSPPPCARVVTASCFCGA